MLEHLSWEYLHIPRQHSKMVLMYRIIYHLVEIPASNILQPVSTAGTRGHNQLTINTCIMCHTYRFAYLKRKKIACVLG